MRTPIRIGLLVAAAGVGISASGSTAAPALKWAAVNLTDTTMIAGSLVSGPVIFIHDDERMARGEPCTVRAPVRSWQGRRRGARRLPLHAAVGQGPGQVHEGDHPQA